jgi:tellurite resistance protein TerB
MAKRYSHPSTTTFGLAAYSHDRHDEEVMRALVTAGAFVALADGRVDPVERDELLNFIDRQRLVPSISQDEIGKFFDGKVQQIKNQRDEIDIAEPLRPLTGLSSASVVVSAAERVAAADLQIHPREVEVLNLIRRIMMTPSDRTDTPTPHASVPEISLIIAALAAISIGAAAILSLATSERAPRTATQESLTVTPNNIDNYLELFADGPGRGWYVLGRVQCDIRPRDPSDSSCEQRPTDLPTSLPPPN